MFKNMYVEEKSKIPEAQNLKAANSGGFLLMMIALPFDNALFHFAGILLITTAALTLHRTGIAPLRRVFDTTRHVQKAFLAILTIMVISNFLNDQGGQAWRTLFVFIFRYGLLFVTLMFLIESGFLTLRYILVAFAVGILAQILPFASEVLDGSIFASRFQGFSSNPNVIGFYAGLGVLIGVYLAAYRKMALAPRLLVSILLILLAGSALVASGNRGGWVALVGAVGCFSAFRIRQNYKTIIPALGLLSFGAFYVFSQFAVPKKRLDLFLNGYSSLRDQVWANSYSLFLEKPFFGYGLDTKSALLQNHSIYSEHNIFLSVLLALGVLGLLSYCFLLVTICWPALKHRSAIGLSAMTYLMGVGMFGFDFYHDKHFMICFVIVCTACLFRPEEMGMNKSTE
ncbi:O-antigen ligase family protein [Alphaproteobacteria bacterium]|nr:O-antigen ligase family protein [Alphaproteobacteria bacterium]